MTKRQPLIHNTMPILVFALLLLLAAALPAWAAPPPIPPDRTDTEQQNRRSRQEAEERRQREQQSDVFLQEQPKPVDEIALPTETPAFILRTLRLEGKEVEHFPWAGELLARYAGRRIGKEGINRIVKRVTNAFIERGYITTRVVVPEQDLSSGELRLTLVPGVIGKIYVQTPGYRGNWQTAFPVRPGDLLNLRDLEQGLEQMKRVPSQEVDMQLIPGKQPGESDIAITVKQANPTKAVFSLDDSGSKATGRLQSSATVSIDNLFGINDLFNVSFNNDAEQESHLLGTRGHSFTYSAPYGNWTFTLAGSDYRYHQTVAGYTQSFVSSGKTDNIEFRVQRLLNRDQTSKTHMQFRVIKGHRQSFIDDTEIEVQRKNTTAAELALVHRQYFGQTVFDFQLAQMRGISWFNAQPEPNTPGTPTTHYRLWTLETGITTPVQIDKIQGRYSLTLRAQTTKSPLYASEYFSIGNRYTVRGFDGEQTLAAEKGWLIRNELSLPFFNTGQESYIGFDYGRVSGPATQFLMGKQLSGITVGLRGAIQAIQYDLFAGWALKKPDGYQTARPALGFQLIYQL